MNLFERLSRGTTIRCDKCWNRFRQNLEDRPLPGGGVMRTFQCPRCGEEYRVARISRRGVELMAIIQALPATDKKSIRKFQRELKGEVTRP